MIAPRWRKVFRDIAESPGRTVLAVVAMAAGAFGVGTILTAYSILTRELATTYDRTRPASAILQIEGESDDALVDSVRHLPGVADAEARPIITGRVRVGNDEWAPLVLFVIRDFDDQHLDTFSRESGAWPPRDDEVLLERAALSVARAKIGDRVVVALPSLAVGRLPLAGDHRASTADGKRSTAGEVSLRIAGTVHAAGLAPAWMDHVVSGFVSWSSIVRSGVTTSAIRIVVAEKRLDERHIRDVAARVRTALRARGRVVRRIDVPAPGRHPHADQMDTFLYLLGAFGALTLVLSAVLVANMIHALLTEQVRQVGVMKAIGATTRQIAALYLGQVTILAVIALCIGIPMGLAAGRAYARFSSDILNANLVNVSVPLWVLALQAAMGILIPLAVAAGPIFRASRITIHEAFSNDVGRIPFGTRRFDRWLARIGWLPRPLMLSLRTAFHRRGRLVLTVSTLAMGGAVFIAALNVSAAWSRVITDDAAARAYDFDVRLSRPYPIAQVAAAIATVPNVVRAESWSEATGFFGGENRVSIVAPPPNSPLLRLPVLEGRWLRDDDRDVVVINQLLTDYHLGDRIALRVNGRNVSWTIVGVVEETIGATIYAPPHMLPSDGTTRAMHVDTRGDDATNARDLERALQRAGISVAQMQSLADRRKAIEDHLIIIKSALVLAAMLVILVGGLGLTSTLTLNVLDRTREIGILSAIGATPRTIARYVVVEGLLMALLSWCAAILVAMPATAVLADVAGRMFHRTPLAFLMSPAALATWLGVVVILAAISSFYPARRSIRMAVREALAYE